MKLLRFLACGLLAVLTWSPARSADPQPYKVEFKDTPVTALNDMLKGSSELSNLRKSAPVGAFGLIGRAHSDIGRLKTVLDSFGYYQGNVQVTIDSLPLDDPGLGDELLNRASKDAAGVAVEFILGPQYKLGTVTLTGTVPSQAAAALKLSTGDPAVASAVLAAADRIRRTLGDEGYAFAKVSPPHAKEVAAQHLLNVSIDIAPGERYQLGDIRLTGLKQTKESHVRRRLLIHPGEEYRASAIEAARQDLLAVGVFTQVTVTLENPDTSWRACVAAATDRA